MDKLRMPTIEMLLASSVDRAINNHEVEMLPVPTKNATHGEAADRVELADVDLTPAELAEMERLAEAEVYWEEVDRRYDLSSPPTIEQVERGLREAV